MNPERRGSGTWDVPDMRRACGLRAQDVVESLAVSPKSYRRFEAEGIVPNRRPRFLDEVAAVFGISRRVLERAIDAKPEVRIRRERASELVETLADRYVPDPGPWKGPSPEDPELIELATAYGRPVHRTRRVLTHELSELRQIQVRYQREQVIANFDVDLGRQNRAATAMHHWRYVYRRRLQQIPGRLEEFHRNAQPADVWELLVDLHNVEAVSALPRGEGHWAVAKLLTQDTSALPPYLVEQQRIDGVAVCRLTTPGFRHVMQFQELYAYLHPGVRRLRPMRDSRGSSPVAADTFTLPNRHERLVIPHPALENMRKLAVENKIHVIIRLNQQIRLSIGSTSISLLARAVAAEDLPVRHLDLDERFAEAISKDVLSGGG
jgi:hypothetical protein